MPISNPKALTKIQSKIHGFCTSVLTHMEATQKALHAAKSADPSGGDRIGLDQLLTREQEQLVQLQRKWEDLEQSIQKLNRKIRDLRDINANIVNRRNRRYRK